MPLDKYFYSYLAGFFDGEGSISINTRGKGLKYGGRLRVSFSNTHQGVLKYINTRVGGTISGCNKKLKKKNKQRLDSHRLVLNGVKAQKFLKEIYLSLIIKKEQAGLAIKFPIMRKGERLSNKQMKERRRIRNQIHLLNRRGRPDQKFWKNITNTKRGGN